MGLARIKTTRYLHVIAPPEIIKHLIKASSEHSLITSIFKSLGILV